MNKITMVFCLLVCCSACSRQNREPGVPFQKSHLSATELGGLPPSSKRAWQEGPIYRAKSADGVPRHICLKQNGLGTFAFCDIAVFFPDGRLKRLTRIHAPSAYKPYRLLQSSLPMIVWFQEPGGQKRSFFNSAESRNEMEQFYAEAGRVLREEIATATNAQVDATLRRILDLTQEELTYLGDE